VNPERQSSPHAHSVTVSPDNRFVLACDLGLDKIFTYRLDPEHATLRPAVPPFTATTPGTGPRHFAFSPDGKLAFVIGEITGTLTSYRYDEANGSLHVLDEQSTLHPPPKVENRSAAVRVHPTEDLSTRRIAARMTSLFSPSMPPRDDCRGWRTYR
jgi:6-phosphogluconolactonase